MPCRLVPIAVGDQPPQQPGALRLLENVLPVAILERPETLGLSNDVDEAGRAWLDRHSSRAAPALLLVEFRRSCSKQSRASSRSL